jgi:hypothetical protein
MPIKMLSRETLSVAKQAALAALQKHPGWKVLKEDLLADAVRQASNDLLDVDTSKDTDGSRVRAAHATAKLAQDFANALVRSVEVHASAANEKENSYAD